AEGASGWPPPATDGAGRSGWCSPAINELERPRPRSRPPGRGHRPDWARLVAERRPGVRARPVDAAPGRLRAESPAALPAAGPPRPGRPRRGDRRPPDHGAVRRGPELAPLPALRRAAAARPEPQPPRVHARARPPGPP